MSAADPDLTGSVVAVHRKATYEFSKDTVESITLIAGLGVEDDAHLGATVQHRSRVAADPTQPNLRQVHLIMSELLDEVNAAGHSVVPGQLGENVTTAGIDLIGLPVGAMLRLGDTALVSITGLRNPCPQIKSVGDGVLEMMFVEQPSDSDDGDEGADAATIRKVGRTGVMGVVVAGGVVRAGDPIAVRYPAGALTPLERV
jgi:MOSC domain-containing protein YiiM